MLPKSFCRPVFCRVEAEMPAVSDFFVQYEGYILPLVIFRVVFWYEGLFSRELSSLRP